MLQINLQYLFIYLFVYLFIYLFIDSDKAIPKGELKLHKTASFIIGEYSDSDSETETKIVETATVASQTDPVLASGDNTDISEAPREPRALEECIAYLKLNVSIVLQSMSSLRIFIRVEWHIFYAVGYLLPKFEGIFLDRFLLIQFAFFISGSVHKSH